MKRILSVQAILLMLLLGLVSVQCADNKKIQHAMEIEAEILNKQCPAVYDEVTRLDSCIVLPGKIFVYNYTMTSSEDMTVEDIISGLKLQKPIILNQIKKQPGMDPYRKEGVVFRYLYNDAEGKNIYRIDITPEDYK